MRTDLRVRIPTRRFAPTAHASGETGRSCATVMRMNAADIRPSGMLRTVTACAALHAVTALVSLCALTQFAIQAWLSYSFARDVWRIPGPLCAAVIAALDLFVTVFMVLTYLLRAAKLRVRAYAWCVLASGIGAQLFAAELFAQYMRWATPVRVFAALPALFLAASLHGLIKYRQHSTMPTDEQGREPEREVEKRVRETPTEPFQTWLARLQARVLCPVETTATMAARAWVYQCLPASGHALYVGSSADLPKRLGDHRSGKPWWSAVARVVIEPYSSIDEALVRERALIREINPTHNDKHTVRDRPAGPRPPTTEGGRYPHPHRELAIKRVEAGERVPVVAKDLGLSRRTVENWTRDFRTQRDIAPVATDHAAMGVGRVLTPKDDGVQEAAIAAETAPARSSAVPMR